MNANTSNNDTSNNDANSDDSDLEDNPEDVSQQDEVEETSTNNTNSNITVYPQVVTSKTVREIKTELINDYGFDLKIANEAGDARDSCSTV
jgi:hypothetical protein